MNCDHKFVELNATVVDKDRSIHNKTTYLSVKVCEICLVTTGKILEKTCVTHHVPFYPYIVTTENSNHRPATQQDTVTLLSQINANDFCVTSWDYHDVQDWDAMMQKALKLYILKS